MPQPIPFQLCTNGVRAQLILLHKWLTLWWAASSSAFSSFPLLLAHRCTQRPRLGWFCSIWEARKVRRQLDSNPTIWEQLDNEIHNSHQKEHGSFLTLSLCFLTGPEFKISITLKSQSRCLWGTSDECMSLRAYGEKGDFLRFSAHLSCSTASLTHSYL